ncbi:MAG: tetratricopeptide repeat protein [Acidobacteriota bacterium]
MKQGLLLVLFLAPVVLPTPAQAQAWKGIGRLEGKVVDAEGKPVPDASVKFECTAHGGGPTVTADKKGKWSYLGLTGCDWKIEVSAPGFGGRAIVVNVPNDQLRQPPVNVTLDKLQGPPPELVAAIKMGDEAFAAQNWTVARENYEKVLALKPELGAQVYSKLARTYVGEKNPAKAIEYLEKSIAGDPTRTELRFAAAQAALDAGLTEQGMTFLAAIDDAAVKSSDGYFNIGVAFLRASDMANAIAYLSKAIAKDEKMSDAYYWRGMSYVRENRLPEAKVDMQKVVELDPAGQYAEKAKTVLDQLKGVGY